MEQYIICCNICYNLYCDDNMSNICYFCENIINIIHYNRINLDPSIFIYRDYILKIKYKTIYDQQCIKCNVKNCMDIDEIDKEYIIKYYPLLNIINNDDTIYNGIDTMINLNSEQLQYYYLPKIIYNDMVDCLHGITNNIISAKICQINNRIILNT